MQSADLIKCFPVIVALSDFTIWSFGPRCAICLPALHNSSYTHDLAHAHTHRQASCQYCLRSNLETVVSSPGRLSAVANTSHVYVLDKAFTVECKLEAACQKILKKCNVDRGFMTSRNSSSNGSNNTKKKH